MTRCTRCGSEVQHGARSCPSCAQPVDNESSQTRTVFAPSSAARAASRRISSEGRFPPGTLLAGRYRIVALLGRGGMGEVYRAGDLALDQQVALKFLPEAVAANPASIDRFRNEVRMARQVSHPNVCRVYDLGQAEGHWFLSMEYVDGEDLGSLLRRIGRLPADKALEIARKLCAGLAAAHGKGVLHRDLKPGNVMLDSRGEVLLTDFGLAGLAGEIGSDEIRNGTPAYMAPEQLAGEEVTVRSDLYSLGLVLYEVFTGKLPFESDTLAGLLHARKQSSLVNPSILVKDLDPAVERVILRCLQPKAADRPGSALAVAAALPGGNALEAALAAGETPSPEMVAAAGEGEGLSLAIAIPLLAAIVIAFACFAVTATGGGALEALDPAYPPEVLQQKARDLIQRLGGVPSPADSAYGFDWENAYIGSIGGTDKSHAYWREVAKHRPALLRFWYRQASSPIIAISFHSDMLTPGLVDTGDPPPTESQMTEVDLDDAGRLLYYLRVPAQKQEPAKNAPAVDWSPLFAAAGLDPSQLQPAGPLWTFLAASDMRAAWTGVWPGSKQPLRVEAAALRGSPVAFSLIGDWTPADREPDDSRSLKSLVNFLILAVLALVLCLGSALLARSNIRRGSGDMRGAVRVAAFIFWVQMAVWLCRSHFTLSPGTFAMFLLAICTSAFQALVVWALYVALEPFVRRRWPQTLIGWSAVLTGKLRDPIVGRDVLIGLATGIGLASATRLIDYNAHNLKSPLLGATDALVGMRATIGLSIAGAPKAVRDCLLLLFLLFLLRSLLRSQWLGAAAYVAIFSALNLSGGSFNSLDTVETVAAYAVIAFLLLRWGLLAFVFMYFSNSLLHTVPFTGHVGAWYFGESLVMVILPLALAAWAFRTAIAGRTIWRLD